MVSLNPCLYLTSSFHCLSLLPSKEQRQNLWLHQECRINNTGFKEFQKSSLSFSLPVLNPKDSIHDAHAPQKKIARNVSHQIFDFAKTLVKPSFESFPPVFWWCSQVFHGLFTHFSHFKMDQTNQNNGLEKNALDLAICNWTWPLGRFAFFLLYWLSTHSS